MKKATKPKTVLIPKEHGLRRLLSEDPAQFLLYAVEKVQEQAHFRRLGRVLKRSRRRRQDVGWVHASEADNPCDRVIGAALLGYTLPRDPITKQQERIFDNGHFMHLRWQNYFMSLPPAFKVQVSPLLRRWPIVGEADVTVEHAAFGRVVIELKSMNDNMWKALKSPMSAHHRQANVYTNLIDFDSYQVWYENKNTQGVKAYSTERDQSLYRGMVDRVVGVADQVLAGKLPKACGDCAWDRYIADLKWDDARAARLSTERAQWQHQSQ